MTETASVIILTYNRLELTKKMLDSFFQTTDSPYHLIIVDNNSTDGSKEYLEQLNPSSQYCQGYSPFFYDENKGVAGGKNRGMLIANNLKNNYISMMDNDVQMPQGWLKESIEIIKNNPEYYVGVNFEGVRYPLLTKNGHTFQHKERGNLGGGLITIPKLLHEKIGYLTISYNLYGEEDP